MAVDRCRAGTASFDGRRVRIRLAAMALLVVSLFGVASIAHPMTAWAVSSDAQQLLNLINQERAAVGAQPLSLRDDLVQIAADHSAWMASTGIFQHRSDLSAGVTGPWTRIGENIAYGWSVSKIHEMFMESEGHCKNNLYAGFNRVGVEFATGGNGAKYVTVVFVQESGGSLPATTLCPYDYSTTTTTAPPATTTTTTPPATTTTTAPPATTTTTAPPATTTTTAAPATTTTTAAPATTTTTTTPPVTSTTSAAEVLLPLSTTTTAPPVTSTTSAGEVVLPLSTTTTSTSTAVPNETGADATESSAPPPTGSVDEAAGPADGGQNRAAFPVAPVAGGAVLLSAAGAWWLVGTKRAAARVMSSRQWGIPHGGIRPPQ